MLFAVCLALLAIQDPKPSETPKPAPGTLTAQFKDGLYVKSEDGNFELFINGHMFIQGKAVAKRPDDANRTAPDSFSIRQARPEFWGTFYKEFEYKCMFDFPTTAANNGLMDGYIGWKRWPEFQVRVGQFKEPFGLEETTNDSFLEFIERGVANRLVPSRDIGVMVHGKLCGGEFEYQAAVYNGSGRVAFDANDEKEGAARLRFAPFANVEGPLKGLRLGIAGTYGEIDTTTVSSSTALDLSSNELAITFLDATAGNLDGLRTRLGAELQYANGPFCLRAEYIKRRDHVDVGGFDGQPIDVTGWTAIVGYILTGEKKLPEYRIVPDNAVPDGGIGAIELLVRASSVKVDDKIFDHGIAPAAGNSDSCTAITVGINWQLTRNVRLMLDLINEKYGDKVTFSNGDQEDSFNGVIFRTQLDF